MEQYQIPGEGGSRDSSSESESETPEEAPETATPTPAKRKRKVTARIPGSPPSRKRTTRNSEQTEREDAFVVCMDSLSRAREGYEWLEGIVQEMSRDSGVKVEDLPGWLRQKLQNRKVQEQEIRIAGLLSKVEDLRKCLREQKNLVAVAGERAEAIAVAAATAASFAHQPGDVIVKANLFDEGLKVAADFDGMSIRKFIKVIIDYQTKMEKTLEEMRVINFRILQSREKGKQKVDPEPSSSIRSPHPKEQEDPELMVASKILEGIHPGAGGSGQGNREKTPEPSRKAVRSPSTGSPPDSVARRTRSFQRTEFPEAGESTPVAKKVRIEENESTPEGNSPAGRKKPTDWMGSDIE